MIDTTRALTLARDAFSGSTSYFDANIRPQVERDIRAFQSRHSADSKYLSESYRARAKFFRPKTRAMVRKNEAIAAEAFFSTLDLVAVTAEDEQDERQLASAEVMKALLNYRLKKSIPWFLILCGAYQDSMVSGVVISRQDWEFDPKRKIDRPVIDLIPIENFRFDPGASWVDPVGTSPYLIELVPMYVKDVKKRMRDGKWLLLTDAEIKSASRQYDSTRMLREDNRTDSRETTTAITDFSIVWVHRNVVEEDGTDFIYYTLGTEYVLSSPVPLEEVYAHGRRQYVVGYSSLETHKNYPSGPVRLGRDLQNEANEIANQRIDNVKFAMNKRYFAKRNKQVDIRSLVRNVPSSVTLMQDLDDVKVIDTPDVTASSYNEQDRLNLDYDDLTGSFSNGSVQGNRRLNETVGGMNLLNNNANQISSYQLKTFTETWIEPVLRQLVLLEQHYETDEKVLALAGKQAELFQRFGIDQVTDDLLTSEVTLSVDVGMGSTNPNDRINNLITGVNGVKDALADGVMERYGVDPTAVIKEVFGALGHKNGGKFFKDLGNADPKVAQLEQQVQELQAALLAKHPPRLIAAQIRKLDAEIRLLEATKVNKGVEASFGAMQAAEVIAAVPQVAPIADKVMQAAGYTVPNPVGIDPNFPVADGGLEPAAEEAEAQGPIDVPESGNTSPMFPDNPQAGANAGIETQEFD